MNDKTFNIFMPIIVALFIGGIIFMFYDSYQRNLKETENIKYSISELNEYARPIVRIGKSFNPNNWNGTYIVNFRDANGVFIKVYDQSLYEMKSDTLK